MGGGTIYIFFYSAGLFSLCSTYLELPKALHINRFPSLVSNRMPRRFDEFLSLASPILFKCTGRSSTAQAFTLHRKQIYITIWLVKAFYMRGEQDCMLSLEFAVSFPFMFIEAAQSYWTLGSQ